MNHVTSKDGTSIAYDSAGAGPAVILVGGGLDDGSENAPLVPELAEHFTVYNYARRGRGDSGDTPPHTPQREFEDLEALIAEAGGSAHLYGVSSGGALVLEAAAAGLPGIERIAVYEVPYNVSDEWPQIWQEYVENLNALLAEGRRGDALALFMRLTGASEEDIASARQSPFWAGGEALAHTLAYEAACLGNGQPPTARLQAIAQPALVITGEAGLDPYTSGLDFFDAAADAIVAAIPHAERLILKGQTHVVDPKVIAPVLKRFNTQ